MYKIGFGYDIHRFAPKRDLVLGGVKIPSIKGLLGHSDADIVIHSLSDAILGAMGEKDIGQLFPNTDLKYKGISSLEILKKVQKLLEKNGFLVGNVNIVILLEAPKIALYKEAMRKNIASILKIDKDHVGISATTHEGVGEIGRGRAAAAYVVALIEKQGRNLVASV
jgi:2-C-methyl-D-erythritol 2,4-cyclodiphosphate synthase